MDKIFDNLEDAIFINNDFSNAELKSISKYLVNLTNLINNRSHRYIKIVKTKYGLHYSDCVWSRPNATEGPDTCKCCFVKNRKIEVLKKKILKAFDMSDSD